MACSAWTTIAFEGTEQLPLSTCGRVMSTWSGALHSDAWWEDKRQSRLPSEAVKALSLEVFKSHLDTTG